MAHIAACMTDAGGLDRRNSNAHIPKPPPQASSSDSPTNPLTTEQKPFVWRMQQQPEAKRYQLFPVDKQTQTNNTQALNPEQARALALGLTLDKTENEKDKAAANNGLRVRLKELNLVRRRKVSVPDLGPMTTVQEVAMDSPTIPGRPPIHERSISAPGDPSRHHFVEEAVAAARKQDILREHVESESTPTPNATAAGPSRQQSTSEALRPPMSPKDLAPLVIPTPQPSRLAGLTRQMSLSRLRSGSTPVEPTSKSARTDGSPRCRTPYTPLTGSSAVTAPTPATTTTPSTAAFTTPASAPYSQSRFSPTPHEAGAVKILTGGPNSADGTAANKPEPSRSAPRGHTRGASESGSIMERGRPRKRTDRSDTAAGPKIVDLKRTKSIERKMFEELPVGHKASDAVKVLNQTEIFALQKQAHGQASRFEVLKKDQVESLSKELRQLDERTEYLRRTYNSLRAGRRNLHSRVCQYLRSRRTARFSTDLMLKQEEALAELDSSIDDWVTKLEHAENRRARVRQKLLEHVAAAAILPTAGAAAASESLQQAMGLGVRISPTTNQPGLGDISTPPRSPTRNAQSRGPGGGGGGGGGGSDSPSPSLSPQRVVAQVPSTILEHPNVEEAVAAFCSEEERGMTKGRENEAENENDDEAAAAQRRADVVESIRVYADRDVYSLLADVENEINKMSGSSPGLSPRDGELKEVHRARSHGLLNGGSEADSKPSATSARRQAFEAPASLSKGKEPSSEAQDTLLPNAVFRR